MDYFGILTDQVRAIQAGVVAILPNLAIAMVVLTITWLLAKFAIRIAERVVGTTHLRENLKQLIETLVRLAIWLVGVLAAATIVIPGFTPAGLIAGLGIGAVAIGFAFQDIFENFLAGVLIMLREKMGIGDSVEVQGISGKVEKITLRETHIRQFTSELTIMPNSMLFKNPVKILTDQDERRDEITVGIAYDVDLKQAIEAIRRAFDGLQHISPSRSVGVYVREFGASSIDILVQWWSVASAGDLRDTRTRVILAIKRELDGANIDIPFPHVTHTFEGEMPTPVLVPPKPADETAAATRQK